MALSPSEVEALALVERRYREAQLRDAETRARGEAGGARTRSSWAVSGESGGLAATLTGWPRVDGQVLDAFELRERRNRWLVIIRLASGRITELDRAGARRDVSGSDLTTALAVADKSNEETAFRIRVGVVVGFADTPHTGSPEYWLAAWQVFEAMHRLPSRLSAPQLPTAVHRALQRLRRRPLRVRTHVGTSLMTWGGWRGQ